MNNLITDFRDKKVSEYLGYSSHVCLWFDHPVMDVVSFMPIVEHLRGMYPNVRIDLCLRDEYCMAFNAVDKKHAESYPYDYVFKIMYGGLLGIKSQSSKNKSCCADELGITFQNGLKWSGFAYSRYSPFVAVDFISNVNDDLGCSREIASEVCDILRVAGYIPIDVHCFRSVEEYVPGWSFLSTSVTMSLAGKVCFLPQILQQCYAYVGVMGDSWTFAYRMFGDNCLTLQPKSADISLYVDSFDGLPHVDIDASTFKTDVAKWVDDISGAKRIVASSVNVVESRGGKLKSRNVELPEEIAVDEDNNPITFKLRRKNAPRVIHV